MESDKLYRVFQLFKSEYDRLKWLNQFVSKDTYRTQLTVIHIVDDHLVATDGIALARMPIPKYLEEYCKERKSFQLTKLFANPHMVVVMHVEDKSIDHEKIHEQLRDLIAKGIEQIDDSLRITSVSKKYYAMFKTMPGDNINFYVKDPTNIITIKPTAGEVDTFALLMPVTGGYQKWEKGKRVK